jgi:diguanylate cyclase (GGDEF)-like protein
MLEYDSYITNAPSCGSIGSISGRSSARSMRVLVIEDSAVDRRIVTKYLKEWKYPFEVTTTGGDGWIALQAEDAPKLVIMDWMLPDTEGVELCRKIRERTDRPYTYIMLVTARDQKHDILQAMEAGADDYLVKPFNKLELKARLIAASRILNLQEQLIRLGESLRFAATHDNLTGLWNRAHILNFLERELVRSSRDETPVGIVLADLDHFKKVNDTFGHLAGDVVLKDVSKRMHGNIRVYDGIGRYGGEEFLVVFPGCEMKIAMRRGEDLRRLVSEKPIFAVGHKVTVTGSFGVAVAEAGSDVNVEMLLQQADQALYDAKRKGRNRVEAAVKP